LNEKNKIKVLIVDDHPVVRNGLITFLENYDDINIIGEAENGKEAIEFCENSKTDVVLMDIRMPKLSGIEATDQILKKIPNIKVIILTSFIDKELIANALKVGASSYLLKNEPGEKIIRVIRDAFQGKSNLSSEVTQIMISELRNPSSKRFQLTRREKEILSLMVEGLSNKEIARRLTLSTSTIQFHVTNILSKLGVSKRTEAIYLAIKQNLVKLPG
jgi:NarL family two-component system response regulator LiaR